MAGGKCPPAVQKIFDKYIHNNVRRLKKADAIKMMMEEFELTEQQSGEMFDSFDMDHNGVMTIREFQAFYASVGNGAQQMIEKFQELDADGSGKLDLAEAREGLKSIKMAGDRSLSDKEIDFFLNSSLGDDDVIDLGEFANLLFKLKMFEQKQMPKKKIK